MNAMPARKVSVKKKAAARSAFRALASSSWYPVPPCPSSSAGSRSWVVTCGGVPITRLGACPSSSEGAPLVSLVSDIVLLLGLLCGDPHRRDDDQSEPDEPACQAFGHRADSPEAAAAGVGLAAGLGDVRDDRPLLRGGQRRVVEDRHRLRTGQHGLVDLLGRRLVERRGVLATGQRAAGAGEVVA